MREKQPVIETCKQLLDKFHAAPRETKVEKLVFSGVGNRDVYNITAPFRYDGEEVIVGRVEERNSEFSQVFFFTCTNQVWKPRVHTHTYNLQDPCITFIKGELIFGGVEIITSADNPDKIVSWVTQFYRGLHIDSLCHFSSGPGTMKDIRLIELQSGQIGIFTRPQGDRGGRGQIGFTIIPSLEELNEQTFLDAEILQDQFVPEEWGGASEAHLLKNGHVGVLGHIACFDSERNKHYYSMVFSINPETCEKTPMKIIAVRDDFPRGPGKRPDLEDVIFSGGLIRLGNGRAILSVGVSDAEAYRIEIPDPFIEYE
ncbi:DUF1861 family protein [Paenibacillus validus]|uniref:DUF1861 family protein n=1 Tax=Paenibacillus validus TaxID=44253 RepID=A0A7X2ZBA6_9BACL|nr:MULTISPECIES: DUF1861 family protein [Paenibacillus]MED4600678.1 DUF1861 family protein [Paenibacillus validus]MED4605317.1 DUF1861 family protein [Paenibacillus validus]MUG71789.1 DUF1861 family protein [Paenibacillus validus]